MGHPGRTSGTMARDLCMWAGPHPTAWKVDGNHVRPLQGRPVVRSSVFAEFPVNLYNFAGGSAAKLLFEKFNKIFERENTRIPVCSPAAFNFWRGSVAKNTVCNRPVSFDYRRPSMESTGRDRTTVSAGVWRPALSAMVCIMGTLYSPLAKMATSSFSFWS